MAAFKTPALITLAYTLKWQTSDFLEGPINSVPESTTGGTVLRKGSHVSVISGCPSLVVGAALHFPSHRWPLAIDFSSALLCALQMGMLVDSFTTT